MHLDPSSIKNQYQHKSKSPDKSQLINRKMPAQFQSGPNSQKIKENQKSAQSIKPNSQLITEN
jgi:hypothetical protein